MKRLTGTLTQPHLSSSLVFTFPLQYLFLFHSQSLELKITSLFSIFDLYKSKRFPPLILTSAEAEAPSFKGQ